MTRVRGLGNTHELRDLYLDYSIPLHVDTFPHEKGAQVNVIDELTSFTVKVANAECQT